MPPHRRIHINTGEGTVAARSQIAQILNGAIPEERRITTAAQLRLVTGDKHMIEFANALADYLSPDTEDKGGFALPKEGRRKGATKGEQ